MKSKLRLEIGKNRSLIESNRALIESNSKRISELRSDVRSLTVAVIGGFVAIVTKEKLEAMWGI